MPVGTYHIISQDSLWKERAFSAPPPPPPVGDIDIVISVPLGPPPASVIIISAGSH